MRAREGLERFNWRWFSFGVALCWLMVGLALLAPSQLNHRAHGQTTAGKKVLGANSATASNKLPEINFTRNTIPVFKLPPKPFRPVNCAISACVALSFDDGPDERLTNQVADLLANHGDHATFFVIGNRLAGREATVKYAYNLGMEIGNHSWAHPDFLKLNDKQITQEAVNTQNKLQAMGINDHLFRVPYGRHEPRYASAINLPIIYWNLDPSDWKNPPADKLTADILGTVKNGSLIILHDVRPTTLAALPAILDGLDSRFRVVSVSELMGWQNTYPANGIFYGR